MAKLKFRYTLLIILMGITALAVSQFTYKQTVNDTVGLENLSVVPMHIGGVWHGIEYPLEENIYEILETRAIIHREFKSSKNEDVFLSIVHYNDTKVDFHTPESCLGGLGLKTTKTKKRIPLQIGAKAISLEVAEIQNKTQGSNTLTYYFYKAGDFAGSNYTKMRMSIAKNKLFDNNTSGSLIRVSTTFQKAEKKKGESILKNFLENLYPYILQI